MNERTRTVDEINRSIFQRIDRLELALSREIKWRKFWRNTFLSVVISVPTTAWLVKVIL